MAQTFFPKGMPLPAYEANAPDAGFWEACCRHELVVQRCSNCGTFRHPPETVCHHCLSFDYHWERVSGKGVVYSHMNVVYSAHQAAKERVPYNVILVEMSEAPGIFMVGNLVDCPYQDICIGMPVEVHFEDHPEENITLPLWKRSDAGAVFCSSGSPERSRGAE